MAWPSPGNWPDLGRLTEFEHSILMYVASGKTNKAIALTLGRQIGFVHHQIDRLFARARVSDRTSLTVAALKLGWIQLDEIELEYDR